MIKFVKKALRDNPVPTVLSAASLGVASANAISNHKARIEGREDRREQTKALKKLNNTLLKVDDSLDRQKKQEEDSKKEESKNTLMNIFRQKNNSETVDGAIKGAAIGASLAGLPMAFDRLGLPNKFGMGKLGVDRPVHYETRKNKEGKEYTQEVSDHNKLLLNRFKILGYGMLIGASLGAIWGGIKDIAKFRNKAAIGSKDLAPKICENLQKQGFIKNQDFTQDPKTANLLKTKVCVVVSRTNGDLKIVINMVNDPKLKSDSQGIMKNLPKSATVTEKIGDRFNELLITTISENNIDPALVSTILEQFIRKGYPVYVVEVG